MIYLFSNLIICCTAVKGKVLIIVDYFWLLNSQLYARKVSKINPQLWSNYRCSALNIMRMADNVNEMTYDSLQSLLKTIRMNQ